MIGYYLIDIGFTIHYYFAAYPWAHYNSLHYDH